MNSSHPKTNWKKELLKIFKLKIFLAVIAMLIIVTIARIVINKASEPKIESTIPSVNVASISERIMGATLEIPGNIEAIEQVSVYSHVSGYLKKIYVDEGDQVKKNQLLAEIDAPDAVQEYVKAKADYVLKKATLDRYTKLLKENVISAQEFDIVTADANESKAKLDNTIATISYTKILSPFDGSVARRFKYPGDIISNGTHNTAAMPIFLIVNEAKLRIALSVSQSDISGITLGNSAEFSVDSLPKETFQGKISRIDALVDGSTKTQRILIDFENTNRSIQAGMYASVKINLSNKGKAVIVIPKKAIIESGGKKSVYILNGKKAKQVFVKTGMEDLNSVQILSGLSDKYKIILAGDALLKDGMEVHPIEAKIQ